MIQFSNRWKSSAELLFRANVQGMTAIELQRLRCGAPGRCGPKNFYAAERKVIVPSVEAGIKYWNVRTGFRVSGCFPRRFPQGTGHTGKRKVFHRGGAAGGLRNDMVNVEAGFLGRLRNEAIFATIVCAANDGLTQKVRNCHELRRRGSNVPNADEGERANRLAGRDLRPRDARHQSTFVPSPVYQAIRGDVVRPLGAGAIISIRRALRVPIELFVTYAVNFDPFCN
jgi:hypothetical protein